MYKFHYAGEYSNSCMNYVDVNKIRSQKSDEMLKYTLKLFYRYRITKELEIQIKVKIKI